MAITLNTHPTLQGIELQTDIRLSQHSYHNGLNQHTWAKVKGISHKDMSFVISDTSQVFTNPVAVPPPPPGTNTTSVPATAGPVQLGGGTLTGTNNGTVGSTTATNTVVYTTAAAPTGQTAQVVVSGAGTRVNVNTGAAKVQAIGGGSIIESVQSVSDTAPKTISLGDTAAAYNGAAVSNTATVSSVVINPSTGAATVTNVPIATVSGGQGGPFAFYAHGGFGNDSIEGSNLSDFIRGGAGNDTINGFGGNDLLRGGTGSDSIFGGAGADTLYYTADQFPVTGTDTDRFADFTSGTDKISFDRAVIASTANINGLGTNTITFTSLGRTVSVVSGNAAPTGAIQASDINFIG